MRVLIAGRSVLGVLGVCALVVGCEPDPDEEPSEIDHAADPLFDPRAVSRFELQVSDEALAALEAAPREYVRAMLTVEVGGEVHGPLEVGLALKGNEAGSFRPLTEKAAFKVKFDELVPGQRLLGLEGVKLNNMIEDASQTHEVISSALLTHLGIPTARAGFSAVYVNGVDYGLHATIERIDDTWAAHHFSSMQHIYEAPVAGLDLEPGNEHEFEVDEGDPDDRADVIALTQAAWIEESSFLDAIDRFVDLDQLLRGFAAGQVLAHWDGYAGGTNNYYLHSDDDGRFTFVPSGLDQSLGDPAYDVWTGQSEFEPQGHLFRRCLGLPTCVTAFEDAVDSVVNDVQAFDASALFDEVVTVIEPFVAADPRRPAPLEEVRAAQRATRAFLVERPASLSASP